MDYDVVVAGAGPVGLLLASELRLGGANVVVVERDTELRRPVREGSMGARALNAPTTAALRLRGLLPAVREKALFWFDPDDVPPSPSPEPDTASPENDHDGATQFTPSFAGHFAGLPIRADRLDPDDPELVSGEGGGVVAQQDLEDVLTAHALDLGVEIRRGVELTGLEIDDTGVTVVAGGDTIRAAWLVGCDGGRSTVRKLAGFAFPGADPVFTGRQALVEMTGGEGLVEGEWQHGPDGSYVVGGWAQDEPTRIHVVEWSIPDGRRAEVTAEELQTILRRVSGVEVTITAVHVATRYTDTTRQADTYRRGRVLLAGDAAHVHSPAGGQGLNLGLGDAMNVGWKLAAVARGRAPESLLDTYTAERHPIGAWVQRWSMAQTALSRGPADPRAEALRGVMADLLDTRHGATYVVKKISGIWQHYDLPGDSSLVGRRVPPMPLTDGSRLTDHVRDGHALLLDGLGDPDLTEITAKWADRLTVVKARPVAYADTPLAAFVRPDGYIAWLGAGEIDVTELTTALETWLGA